MSASVWIVDDDEALRESLADILDAAGYAVESFSSGGDALERLKGCGADLILLDYRLPDGPGFEWAGRFRAQRPGVPIFLMTGMAAEELPAPDAGGAVERILTKPVSPKDLLELIEKTIHS